MRQKVYTVLNKIYGIMMFISFFAGFFPLIPFIVAIMIGGNIGESISVFLYKQYYPWVIVIGSLAILVGLIAMYVGKVEGLSVKKVSADSKKTAEKSKDTKTQN